MSPLLITLIVVGAVVLLLIIIIIASYNGLIKLDERVNEAWSDITVQLKYRADLIPNVVNTVQGYAKHETEAIKQISEARARMMGARSVSSTAEADKSLTTALSRLMMVAESYPDLKANENFLELQRQLQDIEDKLQASRRFYNAGAKELNTKIKLFPTNIFNVMFGFKLREYYDVDEDEKEKVKRPPEVKF